MKTRFVGDRRVQCILLGLALPLLMPPVSWATPLPEGWREVSFNGHTDYQQQGAHWCARSENSASGLVREHNVSLAETPWLSWQWRADTRPEWQTEEERQKAGDDFVARVYVIHEGLFPWQTRAINYVWSRQSAPGEHWPNPYAKQAHMVTVQGATSPFSGQWHRFSRHIGKDFQRFHGIKVDEIDAVAIMTDSDDTGVTTRACYQLPQFHQQP